ncbi:hypothetical protein pdam_00003819 [Pocillopora damicornis]|uniref:PiggyBac transposable element-derived protein domain-containing protein n=1 Tax=Pocillopora damicornis TaxID=46731 RepID=A0A3M6T4D9_POCDA|nr:hypothetical protein pdam_00003819 [Pocillopora damicornis]
MLNKIILETNKIICETKAGRVWERLITLKTRVKAFLGPLIAMNFHSLPSLKDLRSEDWILGMPAFTKLMTRTRFLDLLYNMHVDGN